MRNRKSRIIWLCVLLLAAAMYVFSPFIAAAGNGVYKRQTISLGPRHYKAPRGWIVMAHPDSVVMGKAPISIFQSSPNPVIGLYFLGVRYDYDWKHAADVGFAKEGFTSTGTVVLKGSIQCLTGQQVRSIHLYSWDYSWDEPEHIVAEYRGAPGNEGALVEMLKQ